ncbi:hypothetical protein [Thermomonas sp.]
MSWIAILAIIIGIWLAIKVVGAAFKLVLWLAVFGVGYWLLAPHFGLPQIF